MIETLASKFAPIALQDMVGVKLLNRTDTKFVTTKDKLAEFLRLAVDDYYVQDFFGIRLMPYYTLYYDTSGLDMYLAHHNGRLHRQKVRVREYENEHEKFLEVKNKNNHGRTKKKRIHIQELSINSDEAKTFINEKSMYDANTLSARIENCRRGGGVDFLKDCAIIKVSYEPEGKEINTTDYIGRMPR